MFENIERDEERGQVGIGTLIVFIALVLVAAIAAGVLINTAGFLQNQAESTGQESTQQVSNNVNILSTTGSMSNAGGPVNEITVVVGVGPGSDPIDLADARFELLYDSAYSAKGSTSSSLSGSDGTLLLQDTSGTAVSDSTLSPGERVQVVIDTTGTGGDAAFSGVTLPEGSEADLTITTADGSQTREVLNVPDPIDGSDDVRL
ncbi:archaellin/type IV pilin N-terminal domain-containing protein [Haloglomus salinum]|uniref:archaellin/type IV pilin N-terminal domain-containing protein n=1 Tax=Haloglomus salinum TaxID=2962673 RepID=UPI0020C9F878|nr:archaellin/type IV pilin N-terminal domain-containing protein [Haloglomus salinum]